MFGGKEHERVKGPHQSNFGGVMANVIIAYKTMQKIDALVEADGGASYRSYLQKVLPYIEDIYRADTEPFRSHMGASLIGQECGRSVWLSWRWATLPSFSGRLYRLFNRGHMEEARFISLLLMIGCKIFQQDQNGHQFRISHADKHFGGSGDGVVTGVPDVDDPNLALLSEYKTHGEKSFIELVGPLADYRKHLEDPHRHPFKGKGVRVGKPEHYVQMQVYMRKMGLTAAIYGAVCKNTDDLYMELVTLDIETSDAFLERGAKLVSMQEPPTRINESPGFFKCRFCDHRPVCHLGAKPAVNCRTCKFSKPIEEGKWFCNMHQTEIDKQTQFAACQDYKKADYYK